MILSIDLGQKGALSVMSSEAPYIISTQRMPKTPLLILDSFRAIRRDYTIDTILIEHIFVGKNISKSWKAFKTFSKHKGLITGFSMAIFSIKPTIINAISWQSYWKTLKKGKQANIDKVKSVYQFDTQSDGIADSILIGGYFLDQKMLDGGGYKW